MKIKDSYDSIFTVLSICGAGYGIANIDEVYGIILIVINVLYFITKIGIEIYKLCKGKSSPQDLVDTIGSIGEDVKDIIEEIKEEEINDEHTSTK